MAINKIVKNSITGDAIDATKIADDAISEEHIDITAITGNTELSATAADDDVLLIYDTSSGSLKKIAASNVGVLAATLTSISPTSVNTGDGTGNHTFVITGKNFTVGSISFFKNSSGAEVAFDSLTRNSSTQLTGVIAKSSLPGSGEPYDIVVIAANGTQATLRDQVNINQQPVFVTASGTLGTGRGNDAERFTAVATDPESAGNVTFELQSGTLPPGLSLTNEGSEGGTAVISGTATDPAANTTYNFVLRAVDAASNVSSRAFSITIEKDITFQTFTANGTFAVPSGTTALQQVLIVGGGGGAPGIHSPEPVHGPGTGGGGAGGLVYFPCYPVAPGGTLTVVVGDGGRVGPGAPTNSPTGEDSVLGSPGDPGLGQGGVLTAKGGGGGGYAYGNDANGALGKDGGSGGGGGYSPGGGQGGAAIQPTQPGNSGAYGFGNAGGVGQGYSTAKGGGGGAGAAGQPGAQGSNGGIGKAYTIADGTTSVYYAGGGGGSPGGQGGQGGGAAGSNASYTGPSGGGWPGASSTQTTGLTGQGAVNRGGGAGGVNNSGTAWPSAYNVGNNGAPGVVIIAY